MKKSLLISPAKILAVAILGIALLGIGYSPRLAATNSNSSVQALSLQGGYPSGVTWNTNFVIQNKGSDSATVVVDYYDMDTGQRVSAATQSMTVGANASVAVRPGQNSNLSSNKRYSAVVSSSQPVAAIVNETAASPSTLDMSYVAATAGSTTIYMPNVTRNYAGWNTPLYIQNTSTSNGTAEVKFYRFSDGALVHTMNISIAAGASYEIDPTNVSQLSDNTQYAVIATGSVAIAGVVNQVSNSSAMAYRAMGSGSTKIYLPNIVRNYSDWNTPFIIQNVSGGTVNVTVKYYRFSDGGEAATVGLSSLGNGLSSAQRPHQTAGLSDSTQYSVVIEATGNVVAVANQYRSQSAMSYNGLRTEDGSTKVYLPNITRNYFGWNTPFIIQNVGTSTATVTVKYYRVSDGGLATTVPSFHLGPGRSSAQRPYQTSGLSDNSQYSVVIESSGANVVAIVNQNSSAGGDSAMSYEGIPQ